MMMIIVVAVAFLALITVVGLFQRDRRQTELAWAQERRELTLAWAQERRELLERIQRPERIPVMEPVSFVIPDVEPDELELIGTIADPTDSKDSEDDSA